MFTDKTQRLIEVQLGSSGDYIIGITLADADLQRGGRVRFCDQILATIELDLNMTHPAHVDIMMLMGTARTKWRLPWPTCPTRLGTS